MQTFLQTQGLVVFPDESPGYWLMGVNILNVLFEQTALDDEVGKFKLFCNFSLDTRLSLLLYPFFRCPSHVSVWWWCWAFTHQIEKWGWGYWKSESGCCLCSFACLLPGSSSLPATFSLLGNAPKPTYFPLNNNNPVIFLLSYLPSLELLPCTSFSEWCVHWARESVIVFSKVSCKYAEPQKWFVVSKINIFLGQGKSK